MKIAVVGTGYVGLVVGACLAETGNDVICVDKDEAKVAHAAARQGSDLRAGPGRARQAQQDEGPPDLHHPAAQGGRAAEIVFIAVGTPQGEDGSADLQHVMGVARDIGRAMDGYKVIVNKSTVPVGTAEKVREIIRRETTHPFSVVSNPEFLKQGAAVDDFMKPDRVVIGAEDPRGAELMVALYQPFTRTGAPIMVMDCAERRAVEVRRERAAGDEDLVHERDRQRLRAVRRRRRSRAAGGRARIGASARRSCFPASATAAAASRRT